MASCAILLAVVLTACRPGTEQRTEDTAESQADAVAIETENEVHWGYEGETGPEHWADLSPDFAQCRAGAEQSPIDLRDATPVEGIALERRLGTEVLTLEQRARVMDLVDNGHTIQITNDVPMALDIGEERFELVQYHFHAPSEHTIDGMHSPLEVHFVHKSASGELAVVGVLVEEGEPDPIWEPVISALPSGPGDSRHVEDLELDMSQLRPLPQRYYRYQGSLTTPPCSEVVQWIVMAVKRQVSPEQMRAVVSRLHDNNRPVQPLGVRQIEFVSR